VLIEVAALGWVLDDQVGPDQQALWVSLRLCFSIPKRLWTVKGHLQRAATAA
jgi:hypothetical protein